MPTGKPLSTLYVQNPTEDLQVANKQYVDGAGGGGLVLLDSHVALSTEASYTFTPSVAIPLSTYSKLLILFSIRLTASLAIGLQINGITADAYFTAGSRMSGTALTHIANDQQVSWRISDTTLGAASGNVNGKIELDITNGAADGYTYYSKAQKLAIVNEFWGYKTAAITEIDALTLIASTSTFAAGTSISTYGVIAV